MAIGAAMMKMTVKARFLALPQKKIPNLHHTTQSRAAKHRQVIHERLLFSLSYSHLIDRFCRRGHRHVVDTRSRRELVWKGRGHGGCGCWFVP
jgi:hypothetical protein